MICGIVWSFVVVSVIWGRLAVTRAPEIDVIEGISFPVTSVTEKDVIEGGCLAYWSAPEKDFIYCRCHATERDVIWGRFAVTKALEIHIMLLMKESALLQVLKKTMLFNWGDFNLGSWKEKYFMHKSYQNSL